MSNSDKKRKKINTPIRTSVTVPARLYLDITDLAEQEHRSIGKEIVYLAEVGLAALTGGQVKTIHATSTEEDQQLESAIGFKVE